MGEYLSAVRLGNKRHASILQPNRIEGRPDVKAKTMTTRIPIGLVLMPGDFGSDRRTLTGTWTQCWDGSFTQVYESKPWAEDGVPVTGYPASCPDFSAP